MDKSKSTKIKATLISISNRGSAALEENVSFSQFLLDTALSGLRYQHMKQDQRTDLVVDVEDSDFVMVESVRIEFDHLATTM